MHFLRDLKIDGCGKMVVFLVNISCSSTQGASHKTFLDSQGLCDKRDGSTLRQSAARPACPSSVGREGPISAYICYIHTIDICIYICHEAEEICMHTYRNYVYIGTYTGSTDTYNESIQHDQITAK